MINVHQLPILNDNYIFLIETENFFVCIDPGTSKEVIEFCKYKPLKYILITHHHHDHIGGVHELKKYYNCEVLAPYYDQHRIADVDTFVKDQEIINLEHLIFKATHTPGHTLGHIIYYMPEEKILFCGDTLFRMGCGRLFEGSYTQMYNSLGKIKNLPPDTLIYCTHEYTKTNLEFCQHHQFTNENFELEKQKILKLIQNSQPTIPVTLKTELKTNPFLSPHKHFPDLSPEDGFKKLRELRNNW